MRAPNSRPAVSSWEWKFIGALCFAALLLRIIVAFQFEALHPLADRPVIDEEAYKNWALEIARGDWLGEEVFFQEPLYPYWMASIFAVLGETHTAIRHAQAGLGAITVFLVWALTRRLFGRNPALVAAVAMACYRPALLFPCLLLKPNLFLPLLAGLAWTLVIATEKLCSSAPDPPARFHSRRWLLVGILAGLGALLRGNMLVLLPLFALWPLGAAALRQCRVSRALPSAAMVALGVVSILLPVAWRNHHVGAVWALTTSGAGTNVYGGNNAENPYGIAQEFDWVRGIPEYEAEDWQHEAERRLGSELVPTEVSAYWMGEVVDSILSDPALHLRILWNKLRLSLGSYEVPDNHHLEWDARFVPLLRLPIPGYALWGWLSLAGLLLVLARPLLLVSAEPLLLVSAEPKVEIESIDRTGTLVLVVLYLAYLTTIVLTVTSMRARFALVPLLLPFGGWFVCRAAGAWQTRRPLAIVLAASLAAVLVFVPVFDKSQLEQKLAARDFNWITYRFRADGASDELLAETLQLDQRFPNTLRLWSLVAEIEFGLARSASRAGSVDRAKDLLKQARSRLETVIEEAASNERERHRSRVILGDLASFSGVPTAARLHYEAALAFDPSDAHVRAGLADALLLLGSRDSAKAEVLFVGAIEEYSRSLELDAEDPELRWVGLANAQFLLSELRSGSARLELLTQAEASLDEARRSGSTQDVSVLLEQVRSKRSESVDGD